MMRSEEGIDLPTNVSCLFHSIMIITIMFEVMSIRTELVRFIIFLVAALTTCQSINTEIQDHPLRLFDTCYDC